MDPGPAPPRASRLRLALLAAFVGALALAAYVQTLAYPFVWDDYVFIVKNEAVTRSRPVGEYFTDSATLSSKEDYQDKIYRPARTLLFAGIHAIAGPSPSAFRAVAILLHVACSLLVLLVCLRLGLRPIGASVAGALFAVHPAHCEVVAWISSMADPLMTFFALAGIAVYLRGGAIRKALAVLVALPLALFSKETAVVLPVLYALCGLWPRGIRGQGVASPWRRLAWPALGAAIAVGYVLWRAAVLGAWGQGAITAPQLGRALREIPLVISEYLGMSLWPANLCSLRAALSWSDASALRLVCTVGATACLAAGVVVGAKRRSQLGFGLLWFALGLVPVLNLLPVVVQLAERFVYFPSAGLALALGALVDALHARLGARAPYAVMVSGLAVASLLGLTVARNLSWRDDMTVATSQTECEPPDPNAYWNVGTAAARHRDWPVARAAFETLLTFDERRTKTLDNLAYVYLQLELPDLAETASRRSIAVDPRDSSAWNNLGTSMIHRQLYAQAIEPLETALEIDPGHANAARNLGIARFGLGRYREAAASFERAAKANPDCADCRSWSERARAAANSTPPPQ